MDDATDLRARASDDTRPTPSGPVQPTPDRRAASGSGGTSGRRSAGEDESRADLVRRLREQVGAGTYAPSLDDVAERLAAFFVTDTPYLPPRTGA